MNRTLHTAVFCLAAVYASGCGIKEELYNAKLAELGKTRDELAAQKKTSDEYRKHAELTQAGLDKDNQTLKFRLKELGQKADDTNADLEAARKRMDEMRKAQEQAEKRAAQFRDMVGKFKSMIDAGKLQVEIRGKNETAWKPLKKELAIRQFSLRMRLATELTGY